MRVLWIGLAGLFLGSLGCKGGADGETGDIEIVVDFVEDTRSGTATGDVENTNTCDGFFPAEPQHLMTLPANMLLFGVSTDNPATVVWIVEGQNDWCTDAAEDPPNITRGAWSAGTYEIRVGTAVSGGSEAYTLRFFEGDE